ncbi:hypothetical protein HK105_208175 [Polyrhizophydium stewartii]|uniref:EGF-like domain-containing protein n=1 Tax=Polyrhizophydium stewartii TaxID=2732419 RepID=A0ABR4MYG0_9FUNG
MRSRFLLALAASVIADAAAATIPNPLVFTPAKLAISDSAASNSFGVRLAGKPNGPVTVYFEHPTITFSACSVQFDADSWNTTQTIGLAPAPVIDKTLNTTVAFSVGVLVSAELDTFHGLNTTISGTFDGLSFTAFPHNYSVMLQSPQLDVQVFTDTCYNGVATCNQAMAVRYGTSIMILDVRGKQRPLSSYGMTELTPNVDGILYTPPSIVNSSHVLRLPCGSTVTAVFHYAATSTLDISIRLAAGYRTTSGLCNRPPYTSNGFLVGCNGVFYNGTDRAEAAKFAATWAVSNENNMFLGNIPKQAQPVPPPPWGFECSLPRASQIGPSKYKSPALSSKSSSTSAAKSSSTSKAYTTSAKAATTASALPKYTPVAYGSSSTSAAASPPTLSSSSPPPPSSSSASRTSSSVPAPTSDIDCPKPPPIPPADIRAEIETVCKEMFNITECADISNPSFFIQSCIADVTLTGTYEAAERTKRTFLAKCHADTELTCKHPDARKAARARKHKKDLGFGDNACKRDCSGHGACTEFGCSCHHGWAGVDCSRDLTEYSRFDSKTGKFKYGSKHKKGKSTAGAKVTYANSTDVGHPIKGGHGRHPKIVYSKGTHDFKKLPTSPYAGDDGDDHGDDGREHRGDHLRGLVILID